jgi:hypothetical protein
MTVNVKIRPISTWPGQRSRGMGRSRFRSKWSDTVDLLNRELVHLGAESAILELEVVDRDVRIDGWIRADARPRGPGVILSFESRHGPLRYPCDTYDRWQDNVRAIALSMEALRAVDRYGVTRHGEQYRGFHALPSPATVSIVDLNTCATFLATHCASGYSAQAILEDRETYRRAYKESAKALHPDRGGDGEAFKLLVRAQRAMDRHHDGNGEG